MSKISKSVGKIIKPVARVALPIIGSSIAGPFGGALGGALGGVVSGGGLQGALMGGALGGLGSGLFGGAPSATTSSWVNGLNNSIYGGLSPLRALGQNIVGGVSNTLGSIFSPLKSLVGGTGQTASGAAKSAAGKAIEAAAKQSAGSKVAEAAAGRGFWDRIFDPSMNDITAGIGIMNALGGQQPEGMLTQQQILERMDAEKAAQSQQNARFLASLNGPPIQRTQVAPNTIDYYNYGSRPEQLFFDNVAGNKTQFAKGGKVKNKAVDIKIKASPLMGLGGQDDTVDALLSHGEYVIPADVVGHLGDGNTDAGAMKLDQLLKNVRKHKAPAFKKGSLPPKAKSPLAYMARA